MKKRILIVAAVFAAIYVGSFFLRAALGITPGAAKKYVTGKLRDEYGIELIAGDVDSSHIVTYTSRDLAWHAEYHLTDSGSTRLEDVILKDGAWEKTSEQTQLRKYLSVGTENEIYNNMDRCFEQSESYVKMTTVFDENGYLDKYSIVVANPSAGELYYCELL